MWKTHAYVICILYSDLHIYTFICVWICRCDENTILCEDMKHQMRTQYTVAIAIAARVKRRRKASE